MRIWTHVGRSAVALVTLLIAGCGGGGDNGGNGGTTGGGEGNGYSFDITDTRECCPIDERVVIDAGAPPEYGLFTMEVEATREDARPPFLTEIVLRIDKRPIPEDAQVVIFSYTGDERNLFLYCRFASEQRMGCALEDYPPVASLIDVSGPIAQGGGRPARLEFLYKSHSANNYDSSTPIKAEVYD